MKLLTSDEIFDNILSLVKLANEEIKIASAWIKGDFFRKIIEEVKSKGKDINLEVIIRASEIKDLNITDENVFRLIKSVNGKLFISNRLHAKFIIVDNIRAIIGSANFTAAGLSNISTGNIEVGSLYHEEDEKEEIQKLSNYFEEIKTKHSLEIRDNLIGFCLNPVSTTSFEFIVVDPDIEEQSYVEVIDDDIPILGKITSIYSYCIGFFTNPFSNGESNLFAPSDDFKTIFFGDKHQDWKKAATFAYMAQNDGLVKVAVCNIIGQIKEGKIDRVRKPFNVGQAVYLASKDKLHSFMKINLNNQIMSLPIPIGKMEGTDIDVYIDIQEVVSKHMFITGTTGSGKSFFVKNLLCKLSESESTQNIKVFIFDPHGEYYQGLKDCIEEEHIFHKEFDDVAIPTDPQEVIDIIDKLGFPQLADKRSSTNKNKFSILTKYIKPSLKTTKLKEKGLLDIINEIDFDEKDEFNKTIKDIGYEDFLNSQPSQLKDLDKEDKRIFIYNLKNMNDPVYRTNLTGLILQEIFNRGKKDHEKRLIVLEEAHNFAPERGYGDVSSGKDNISSVIVKKIASEGRKFNIGLIVISQRPAQISKYILSQANTQVMFRIINSFDLESIAKSIEYAGEETINLLPKFSTGTCVVSGIGVPMPMIVKIPNSNLLG